MVAEELIKRMINKGAFLVFAFAFVGASFGRSDVFLGLTVGSLMAYLDFLVICFLSKDILELRSRGVFFGIQMFKYLVMAIVLGVLFFYKVINPLATVIGLSLITIIPFVEFSNLKNI